MSSSGDRDRDKDRDWRPRLPPPQETPFDSRPVADDPTLARQVPHHPIGKLASVTDVVNALSGPSYQYNSGRRPPSRSQSQSQVGGADDFDDAESFASSSMSRSTSGGADLCRKYLRGVCDRGSRCVKIHAVGSTSKAKRKPKKDSDDDDIDVDNDDDDLPVIANAQYKPTVKKEPEPTSRTRDSDHLDKMYNRPGNIKNERIAEHAAKPAPPIITIKTGASTSTLSVASIPTPTPTHAPPPAIPGPAPMPHQVFPVPPLPHVAMIPQPVYSIPVIPAPTAVVHRVGSDAAYMDRLIARMMRRPQFGSQLGLFLSPPGDGWVQTVPRPCAVGSSSQHLPLVGMNVEHIQTDSRLVGRLILVMLSPFNRMDRFPGQAIVIYDKLFEPMFLAPSLLRRERLPEQSVHLLKLAQVQVMAQSIILVATDAASRRRCWR